MSTSDTHDHDPQRARDDQAARADRFDHLARERHAQAVAALSPQLRARLRGARHAARTAPPRRGFGWVTAGGFAALFAVGLAWQLQPGPTPPAATQPLAATPAEATNGPMGDAEVNDLLAALDESPDLYLWLAANDDTLPPPLEP